MERGYRFPRNHRLSGRLQFAAVYDTAVRQSRGPLLVYARPNELSHARLGLSVSRRVGTAVKRNRIKRLIREAFRSLDTRPADGNGYDLVVVVRPHAPLRVEQYRMLLLDLLGRLHRAWRRA
jgi:ribonuclease P protein component